MQIIPRSDQEHLGRVSLKLTVGRGLLLGEWYSYRDRDPLLWGICQDGGISDTVSGGEDFRLEGLDDHLGWGGALAPADRICVPTEVPSTGVGLRVVCHPRHSYGISGSRG